MSNEFDAIRPLTAEDQKRLDALTALERLRQINQRQEFEILITEDTNTAISARICRNCEYWDAGGETAAKTALTGDCLNRRSPRFTPEWDFSCAQFFPDTTNLVVQKLDHLTA